MIVKSPENVMLKTYLREQGYTLNTACGGRGNCGKCVVRVIEGDVPVNTMDRMWFTEEQLRDGYRLGCQIRGCGTVSVEIGPHRSNDKA